MYTVEGTTISLTRGDSLYIQVTIEEGSSTYEPAEGDVIRFAMKQSYYDTDVLVEKIIPNDTLILHLLPEDTKDLNFGKYVYDIQLTKENGDVDTFITESTFVITKEVD